MYRKQEQVSAGNTIAVVLVLASAIAMERGLVSNPKWYHILWVTIPLLAACVYTGRK
jgi:hypothetical protein